MEKCTTIRAHQLRNFESLSETALNKVIETSELLFVSKGTVIFEECQLLNKLYCIKEGACKFSTFDNLGREHILRFLGKGEVMGKRSVISNKGANVTATALTETTLCCFDKNEILYNLKTNSDFCYDLLHAFIEDANMVEDSRIIYCTNKGIKQRLAQLLLYLAEKFGQDPDGKLMIRLKREDMASVLGTSQEYIINLLTHFRKKGFLDIDRSEIVLNSKESLRELI